MAENSPGLPKNTPDMVDFLKSLRGEQIKAKEHVLDIPVLEKGVISGSILPSRTSLYQLHTFGPPGFIIDALSQNGNLSLIKIPALLRGDNRNLHLNYLGTYDRDENEKMIKIYLDIIGKGIDLSDIIFGETTLQQMLEEQIIYRLGTAG